MKRDFFRERINLKFSFVVSGLGCFEKSREIIETKTTSWRDLLIDKKMVKRVMDEVNLQNDFVPDSTATLAKARAMMSELGIRAEDNIFSCGIIAVRDEE